jgi:hypothetical protein
VKALNTGFSSMIPEIKKRHARHMSHNHYEVLVEASDDDDTIMHVLIDIMVDRARDCMLQQ